MANYYAIEIKSEKLTAAVAAELLNKMGEHNLIENFSYHHSREHQGGQLSSYTRGLPNIAEILEKYDFEDGEVKIEDEFERFWNSLPQEEHEKIYQENQVETETEPKSETKYQTNYQSKFYGW